MKNGCVCDHCYAQILYDSIGIGKCILNSISMYILEYIFSADSFYVLIYWVGCKT